jgi:hypothetical protein
MHKAMALVLVAGSLASASAAQAQRWDNSYGSRGYGYGADRGDWIARAVCSGQRAHALEARLNRETQQGAINPGTAERMHDQIDQLEDRSRQECAEGDRRAMSGILQRYERIEGWLRNAESNGWNRGW